MQDCNTCVLVLPLTLLMEHSINLQTWSAIQIQKSFLVHTECTVQRCPFDWTSIWKVLFKVLQLAFLPQQSPLVVHSYLGTFTFCPSTVSSQDLAPPSVGAKLFCLWSSVQLLVHRTRPKQPVLKVQDLGHKENSITVSPASISRCKVFRQASSLSSSPHTYLSRDSPTATAWSLPKLLNSAASTDVCLTFFFTQLVTL